MSDICLGDIRSKLDKNTRQPPKSSSKSCVTSSALPAESLSQQQREINTLGKLEAIFPGQLQLPLHHVGISLPKMNPHRENDWIESFL